MILSAHTDGASKCNPGPAAIGYTIENDSVIIEEFFEYIGETTNNVAEYKAIIAVLKRMKTLGGRNITLFSDSELAVKQITGRYRVKNPGLKPLYDEVMSLSHEFDSFRITHVPRGHNSRADGLANKALKISRKSDG